ncbi:MAG: hypothetical protein JWN76_420 [Chitinophagaceae bacterium]|nr:hypothetical protein [Chitinophagaceae bacterium]
MGKTPFLHGHCNATFGPIKTFAMNTKSIAVLLFSFSVCWISFEPKSIPAKPLDQHLCTIRGRTRPGDSLQGEGRLLWTRKTVSVYFLDDDANVRDRVLKIANGWQPYSGIRFLRSYNQRSSDIRISFRTRGWWSYVGSEASQIKKDSVTLSLDQLYLYAPAKFKSVVLHEFGHCLGLLHEHQHPFLKINWNLGNLYKYYKETFNVDPPWVRQNVLNPYVSNTAVYCEPDKNSIMIYAIPPGLTTDGLVIEEPLDLSESDKKFISKIYNHQPCN